MEPAPIACPAVPFATALARVAADPDLTAGLYSMLGGFCHELRNLLNSLRMTLYIAQRSAEPEADRDVWDDVERRYRVVEQYVDRLQLIARPWTVTPVVLPLGTLFDDRRAAWSHLLAGRNRRLILSPPPDPGGVAFDPLRLGSGLDDLVAWRSWAGDPATDLRVRWAREGDAILVRWDEPPSKSPRRAGPARDAPTDVLSNPMEAEALANLIIPLLTRTMTSHGGTLETGGPGAWHLTLRWPLDARPTHQETAPCSASPPSR